MHREIAQTSEPMTRRAFWSSTSSVRLQSLSPPDTHAGSASAEEDAEASSLGPAAPFRRRWQCSLHGAARTHARSFADTDTTPWGRVHARTRMCKPRRAQQRTASCRRAHARHARARRRACGRRHVGGLGFASADGLRGAVEHAVVGAAAAAEQDAERLLRHE